MNRSQRLLKRHKRHVLRGKARGKVSAPDLRTPEQIKAAREESRPETSAAALRSPR